MTLDQVPLDQLTTPAGVAAAALLIRQIVEIAKKSFLPWLDAGNERKGVFILAGVLYAAWLILYGTDLQRDGLAALAAFWATATAAIGANEAVDAAKGQLAKNVRQASPGGAPGDRPSARAPVIDDSAERTVALEPGPDLDLRVELDEAALALDDLPPDPALAGTS